MSQNTRSSTRVLLLELDSLSLQLVNENLDKLPTLRLLIDSGGALVETKTTADIASASVWPTFATGELPGVHGHYFPFQWHAEKMRFYRPYKQAWSGQLDYKPFWYKLAEKGAPCMVLDAVQSIPQPDSPCLEINDWSSQSSGKALTTDPDTLAELRRRFGKRPIRPEVPVSKSRRLSSQLRAQLLESMKRKTDAIIWLGQNRDWRFYLASIQDVHRAGHNLWHAEGEFGSDVDKNALLDIYKAMDAEVARILASFEDERTFVFLFTLNGMNNNRAQNHFLPQVLERLNRYYLSGQVQSDISNHRRGLMARLRDQVPPGVQYAAVNLLGEKVQDWVVNREVTGSLDWASTPSFAVSSGGEGLIRLNLEQREKHGMLSPGSARDNYVNWIKEKLREIKVTGSEAPLVDDIIDVHEHFPGDRAELLPDLAITWRPDVPATEIHSPSIGTIRQKLRTGRGGNHNGESFAILPANLVSAGVPNGLNHITDYRELVTALLD
jgi:predicted AlkP superfamily phosphohydrolase/phosphomutase